MRELRADSRVFLILPIACAAIGVSYFVTSSSRLREARMPLPSNPSAVVTPADIGVYKALLNQITASHFFGAHDDLPPTTRDFVSRASGRIILVSQTETYEGGFTGLFPDGFVPTGVGGGGAKYNSLRAVLRTRNKHSATIPSFVTPRRVSIVSDAAFNTLHGHSEDDCALHVSLPVYSQDGSIAMFYCYAERDALKEAGHIYIVYRDGSTWNFGSSESGIVDAAIIVDR